MTETRENYYDYIGFIFENVEGVYVSSAIFDHVTLTNYDVLVRIDFSGEEIVMEMMNTVEIRVEEEKFFSLEHLDFRHMPEKGEQGLLSFKEHIDNHKDIVAIQFLNSQTNEVRMYYVDWDDSDEHTNHYMRVSRSGGFLSISISKPDPE